MPQGNVGLLALQAGSLPKTSPEISWNMRMSIAMWMQTKYFGAPVDDEPFPWDNPELESALSGITAHVRRLQAVEDCIILSAMSWNESSKQFDWGVEQALAHMRALFRGAFEKASLHPDFHVVGAFCILVLMASGRHFDEFPFFDPSLHDSVAYYPSLLWRHSVQALDTLLRAAYWDRIWIVQEVALARSARIVYGNHSAPFQLIMEAHQNFTRHYQGCCRRHGMSANSPSRTWWASLASAFQPIQMLRNLHLINQEQGEPVPIDLSEVVAPKLGHRKATDPRDSIYGVLGLVTDGQGMKIVPDYSKSAREVFIQATIAMLCDDGGKLHPIAMNEAMGKPKDLRLPSWVPNWSWDGIYSWSNGQEQSHRNYFARPGHYPLFDAAKGHPAHSRLVDGDALEVKSVKIDVIKQVTEEMADGPISFRGQWSQAMRWYQLAEQWGISRSTFLFTLFGGSYLEEGP